MSHIPCPSTYTRTNLAVYEQPGRNCIMIEPGYNRNNLISELYHEQYTYFNRSRLLRDCARAHLCIEIKKVYESQIGSRAFGDEVCSLEQRLTPKNSLNDSRGSVLHW